jgi:hypothetical protein
MISLMTSLVNQGRLIVHSHILWNEMADYVRVAGMDSNYDQYRGNTGYDDCVMAGGIGLVASDDETYGLHSPSVGGTKSRKDLIAEALAQGGPSRSDDREGLIITPDAFMSSQKGWMKGFE